MRIHLLTGVALMLMAAAILGLNLRGHVAEDIALYTFMRLQPISTGTYEPELTITGSERYFGWPFTMKKILHETPYEVAQPYFPSGADIVLQSYTLLPRFAAAPRIDQLRTEGRMRVVELPVATLLETGAWNSVGVAGNAAVATALLLGTALGLECLLHRAVRKSCHDRGANR